MPTTGDSDSASLCRTGRQTCGACCWGMDVSRDELVIRLERQRKLFDRFQGRLPSRWQLLMHELRSRRGIDLLWAVLLRMPWIGKRMRKSFATRLTCAFMGFDSAAQDKVGCMLHPSRHNGVEIRNQSAFQLLPGIQCGDKAYVCVGCHRFNAMTEGQQATFSDCISHADWFEYTNVVRSFSCTALVTTNGRQRDRSAA